MRFHMKTRRCRLFLMPAMALCVCGLVRADQPDFVTDFTREFCIKCHGPEAQKGDFRIDRLPWNFTENETRGQWRLVADYVSDGDMPPKKASNHPDADKRAAFLKSLRKEFAQADRGASVGGTPPRRLNRVEYLNTVRDLFGIRMINLPLSFPADVTSTEFDTMPRGLFLSPAVMEAYHETATDIADRIVPLSIKPTYNSSYTTTTIGGDGIRKWFGPMPRRPKKTNKITQWVENPEFLMFTGFNNSGWVGALWDPLLKAPQSGVYRVRLRANAQAKTGADGKPLRLGFYAFDANTAGALPKRFRSSGQRTLHPSTCRQETRPGSLLKFHSKPVRRFTSIAKTASRKVSFRPEESANKPA